MTDNGGYCHSYYRLYVISHLLTVKAVNGIMEIMEKLPNHRIAHHVAYCCFRPEASTDTSTFAKM
jgi:hypothetical protein